MIEAPLTMPVATFQHCVLCYKEQEPKAPGPGSSSSNKHYDICRRFCTLSSRYIDLDPYFFASDKTLLKHSCYNVKTLCDDCLEPTLSFCDIYAQMKYLEMQLDWRLHEISNIMKHADTADSTRAPDRQKLKKKIEKFGSNMKEIEEFRAEFIEAVELKQKKYSTPNLLMKTKEKENVDKVIEQKKKETPKQIEKSDSEDDSLFQECTPVKRKKTTKMSKEEVVEVEEKRKPGRPKKLTLPSPSKAETPTPTTSEKVSSKKRPLPPSPSPVPLIQPTKRKPSQSQAVKIPSPVKVKDKVPEMLINTKKTEPEPKFNNTKEKKPTKKTVPVPEKGITYFEIDSNPESDKEKTKPATLVIPQSVSDSEYLDEVESIEEEKVTLFSKPGGKISAKDRVPNSTSYVIGWLNRK
ncbi:unnamed protein product [Orchesella dallaii]|uniref:Uncharacterized protein n=1 Tax=Orchesella dallaii TaxID=48710 RepID=A0ABP1R5E7_9HEXA